MKIDLGNIKLVEFNKEDKNHLNYLKNLLNDEKVTSRFKGILPALMKKKEGILEKGFFLKLNEELCGYIQIGTYNIEEKSVYIRAAALDEHHRNQKIKLPNNDEVKLATIMLNEVTEYLFNMYPEIEMIKLTIAEDNIAAIKHVIKCGYKYLNATHYGKENPNMIKKTKN